MPSYFKRAKLILATGKALEGLAPVWQRTTVFGEVIFNTDSSGYEEIITDQSYAGKIITFTYPVVSNISAISQSNKIYCQGIICQNLSCSIQPMFLEWLQQHQISLITNIDTRELSKLIRNLGSINAALTFDDGIPLNFGDSMAINWIDIVGSKEVRYLGQGKYKIILVDCGAKQGIIDNLLKFDVSLKIVPYDYDYVNEDFDGVFISNGPGNPHLYHHTIRVLDQAMHISKPIYAVSLGLELMALSINASIYKLKFGHYGANHPCIELKTNHCYLTRQNHSHCITENSLPEDWEVTFRHLNDNTICGIAHKFLPFNAVQFNPEAAPGTHDAMYFFAQFIDQVIRYKANPICNVLTMT